MGNNSSKIEGRLGRDLPYDLGDWQTRPTLIRNISLLVRTDPGMFKQLEADNVKVGGADLGYSFNYLVMPSPAAVNQMTGSSSSSSSTGSTGTDTVEESNYKKAAKWFTESKTYVVAIALVKAGTFVLKIETPLESSRAPTSKEFRDDACVALTGKVASLLAKRLEHVPSFEDVVGPVDHSVVSGLPRYEDLNQYQDQKH